MPATLALPPTLVQHSADDRRDLEPAPIPAEDVLDGTPVARALRVAELGDGMTVWLWDCTPGRFRWHFRYGDEVVHIIDGAVTVTDQDGGVVHLGPGDVAAFSAGTWAIWDVEHHVRKVAVTRGLPGDPLSRFARWARRTGKRLVHPAAGAGPRRRPSSSSRSRSQPLPR